MYYVYIAKLPDGKIYIGYSKDLQRRANEHRARKNIRGIVYYEAYKSREEAMAREQQLKKYSSAYGHLKKRIKKSIEST
jgi:predicted GIY-YIG superfamily endonuclease